MVRMGKVRTPSRVLKSQLSRKRPVGRQKRRWLDNKERDVPVLGFEGI